MTGVAEETGLEAWFLHEKLIFSLLPEQELTSLRQRLPDTADPCAETMRTELFERVLTTYLERSGVASLTEAHSRGELHVGQLAWLDQVITFKGMSAALEAIGRGARGTATFTASLATDKGVRVRGEYNAARLTSSTAADVLSGTKRQFILGYVDGIAADEIKLRPVVIATRRLRPVPEIPVWYGDDPLWVTPAAIDQFKGVDFQQRLERTDLNVLKGIPEKEVKTAFAGIFREPEVPKDWGGEQLDLWTAKVSVQRRPLRAAIAFKGPAEFHPMTIATLGKNGDQIDRLAQTAADLMIVQHCHHITPPVINMLKNYANNPRNPKRYMTIDGYDTIKILRHFGRLRLRLLLAPSYGGARLGYCAATGLVLVARLLRRPVDHSGAVTLGEDAQQPVRGLAYAPARPVRERVLGQVAAPGVPCTQVTDESGGSLCGLIAVSQYAELNAVAVGEVADGQVGQGAIAGDGEGVPAGLHDRAAPGQPGVAGLVEAAETRREAGQPQVNVAPGSPVRDGETGPGRNRGTGEDVTGQRRLGGRIVLVAKRDVAAAGRGDPEERLRMPADAFHRDEATGNRRRAGQVAAVFTEGNGAGDAVHPQGDDEDSAVFELGEPGRRNVPRACCHDDRIEQTVSGCSVLAVAGHHCHPFAVARGVQGCGGPPGYLGVDVDGDQMAARADDLGGDGSVVPGRADLQDPRPRTDACLVDHPGLEPRAADRRQGDAVRVLLVPHDVPGVALLQRDARPRERVPGDGPERGLDPRRGDRSLLHELVGHRVAQSLSLVGVYCDALGHSAPLLDRTDGLGDEPAVRCAVSWPYRGQRATSSP
jgi:hypothetical protein